MTTKLLTEIEAAELLATKPSTLRFWRWKGEGPNFCRIGSKNIRYKKSEIEKFIAEAEQNHPSEKREV
ncbi:MAG: helix-turn-helix domain-containing protein [Emcibacteraceae bacterium]|nr:helix-turn-helix domain-containing protein [Emcibacteraceae bacterium]